MSKMTITYEFDATIDAYDIDTLMNATKYRAILQDVDERLRQALKHDDTVCENERFCCFLEELRNIINGEVDLYD